MLKSIVRALLKVLFRVQVEGDTSHFSQPRLLIIANHQSFLDGLILGAFLPVDPVFVVHTEVTRNWFFRLVLGLTDYLAVDPTNPMAMKRVVRLVESGRPVVIFPEGRITITGSLMKVYDGPAFVAARTQAVIVPVRLDGAARTFFSRLSGSNPRELFPRITVSIQPPASIVMPKVGNGRMRRRKAGESMRKIMQEMVFRSRPTQTLYTALVDAMRIYGRGRRLVEDMRQTEYSYNALLNMTLVLGLLARRISARSEAVVLFTTDPGLTRERLQEAAHSLGSSEIAVPRQILNVQQIPLLGTGKVNYVKLKEEAGRAQAIASGA